jgi:energy-coupling factor transporter ATP-binding protein EcfA2
VDLRGRTRQKRIHAAAPETRRGWPAYSGPFSARRIGAGHFQQESMMSDQPAVLVVTGASGAGKSTLVRGLSGLELPGVGCYEFDSIGVPSPEEMERVWGGGEQWQAAMADQWIERLLRNDDGVEVAVLDGQIRPSTLREVFAQRGVRLGRIVLVDCGHDERNARLRGPRGQPELACGQMDSWAAYLTGQAHALGLPILNTNGRSVDDGVTELAAHVRELARLWREPA